MGVVVSAVPAFEKLEKAGLEIRQIHLVMNIFDHVFLKISKLGRSKPNEMIAVPLSEFPKASFNVGDRIKFKLSSKIIAPDSHSTPCAVVSKISKLSGELEIGHFVFREYLKGHPYAYN